MIEVIKANQKLGKDVVCYATHSNARTLCDRERNLNDDQITALKEVDGLIGVFSNRNFITKNHELSKEEQKQEYLKHIIHIANIVGIDNVMLSTDDMRFSGDIDPEYYELPIFDYSTIAKEAEEVLLTHYAEEDTNNIMYENAYRKIIDKLNNKTNYYRGGK